MVTRFESRTAIAAFAVAVFLVALAGASLSGLQGQLDVCTYMPKLKQCQKKNAGGSTVAPPVQQPPADPQPTSPLLPVRPPSTDGTSPALLPVARREPGGDGGSAQSGCGNGVCENYYSCPVKSGMRVRAAEPENEINCPRDCKKKETGGDPGACAESDCGPQLGMPNYPCADGTVGGPTGKCLRNAQSACGWEIRECKRTSCGNGLCDRPTENPETCPQDCKSRNGGDGNGGGNKSAMCPSDPDGGDPTQKTSVSGKTDSCRDGIPNYVNEVVCIGDGKRVYQNLMPCPLGKQCRDGACTADGGPKEDPKCSDSDGGVNIFVKGTAGSSTDTCNTNAGSENHVYEAYCTASAPSFPIMPSIPCPAGYICVDGACVTR